VTGSGALLVNTDELCCELCSDKLESEIDDAPTELMRDVDEDEAKGPDDVMLKAEAARLWGSRERSVEEAVM